ncbi:MAG: hypothetical protein WAT51_11735 [Holophaga sp.]
MSELINNQAIRIQTLKEVILHLHRGEAPEGLLAACIKEGSAFRTALRRP